METCSSILPSTQTPQGDTNNVTWSLGRSSSPLYESISDLCSFLLPCSFFMLPLSLLICDAPWWTIMSLGHTISRSPFIKCVWAHQFTNHSTHQGVEVYARHVDPLSNQIYAHCVIHLGVPVKWVPHTLFIMSFTWACLPILHPMPYSLIRPLGCTCQTGCPMPYSLKPSPCSQQSTLGCVNP